MTPLQRMARRLGYDLSPRRKSKPTMSQLVAALEHNGVDGVIDVGANEGQYASLLREWGWAGPIASIEPVPDVHARLKRAAAGDPAWTILPLMAAGEHDGSIELQRSRESDMSSVLPQTAMLQKLSPSAAIERTIDVPVRRLDSVAELKHLGERLFLKVDVQGYEPEVVRGALRLMPHIVGLQLEVALLPLYDGESDWRSVLHEVERLGFELHLVIPGYFEPKLARQVQMDVVLFRNQREVA